MYFLNILYKKSCLPTVPVVSVLLWLRYITIIFNRPAFIEMMNDIHAGVVNCVIVKDLSRFGRNYLETGRYIEQELPELGCRFIALSEGIDTKIGESDAIPFFNAINDFFVKDVSKRIKSTIVAKAKDGQRLSGIAPYGYDINPNERSQLIVDEYAEKVVKRMFALRATGMGYSKVAGELNKDDIMPPRLYYFQKQGRTTKAVTTKVWTTRTVKLILNNEVYIGNTVSLKRGTRSYQDKRVYRRVESEWIRVENTHSPIIDPQLWGKVQGLNQIAKNNAVYIRKPQKRLFAGLLVCPDCKAKMGYVIRNETKRDGSVVEFGGYICRTYSRSGQTVCSSHKISERRLEALVLKQIQVITNNFTFDESRMLDMLRKRIVGDYKINKSNITLQRKVLEQQLYAFENQIDQLYEDKIAGLISAETFIVQVNSIEDRRVATESILGNLELKQTVNMIDTRLDDIAMWVTLIKEKPAPIKVDRELLISLIKKIEVGEKIVINDESTQDVRMYFL